ncbi:MAG: hypothetical protein F6K55_34055 [Moorea sp. SIO4A3]|nr:hypothetical protein [Moorena sp. SIO4A3]
MKVNWLEVNRLKVNRLKVNWLEVNWLEVNWLEVLIIFFKHLTLAFRPRDRSIAGLRPSRSTFNLPFTEPQRRTTIQPSTLAFGHAIANNHPTFNLGLWPRDREQPSNLQPSTLQTLAFRPRYANNLQTFKP